MAKYDEKTGFSFIPYGEMDPFLENVLHSMFDEQVEYDIEDILLDQKDAKIFKQLCIIKTLLYPAEYVLTLIFMGKKYAKEKTGLQSLYWKFLRKKMGVTEFKSEIVKIARAGV